jgi:acyl-CoA thioester hydrolase
MTEFQGSGRFAGKTHILPIRIYYEDTDLSGVVYHANYLRFMERGRSEFFRASGVTKLAMLDDKTPSAWTIRKIDIDYIKPARLDDLVEVRTDCISMSGARVQIVQKIFLNDTLLTEAKVEACVMSLSGKPLRLPSDIRERLSPFLHE